MHKFFSVALLLVLPFRCLSQDYAWVHGSSTSNIPGNYGTIGIPSSTNDPGGRHGSATWVDAAGNLWLFGGHGLTTGTLICWMNDLWKYNPSSNQWTWIRGSNLPNPVGKYGTQGIASSGNDPGGREFCATWTDSNGNFWLFGGDGYGSTSAFGRLADLWKYNPGTNQWTWVKGANLIDQNGVYGTMNVSSNANNPGSRIGPANWTDSAGNFWLWGGRGFPNSGPSNFLDDLWKFDPASSQWTWIKGSNTGNQSGVYGTMTIPSATVSPGGREFPGFWYLNGELYLFAGRGYPAGALLGYLNDLWKYNISTGQWTWMNGQSITNQNGVYGTQGIVSTNVIPGSRISQAVWPDGMGKVWLFGGYGYASVGIHTYLNDFFCYDPTINQFGWMKGSNLPNQNGTYGSQNVPSASNTPGGRYYNNWWSAQNTFLWLFGGIGFDDTSSVPDNMNDLWRFTIPCNPDSVVVSPSTVICSGTSGTINAITQFPSNINWYSSPTPTSSIGSGSTFVTPTLSANSGNTFTYYVQANSCTLTPLTPISISVQPLPVINVSGPSAVCNGSTFTLVATGASSYLWNAGTATGNSVSIQAAPNTTYITTGTTGGCSNSTSFTLQVLPLPTLSISSTASVLCKGDAATLTACGALTYTWNNNFNTYSITVTPTTSTTYLLIGAGPNSCTNSISYTQNVKVCTSLASYEAISPITIFPNPGTGEITISGTSVDFFRLLIFDATGNQVAEFNRNGEDQKIDTRLSPGIYWLVLADKDQFTAYSKLIIVGN